MQENGGTYMEEKKKELLDPKMDIVFQTLFQNNKKNITTDFVSDILGERVEIIEISAEDALIKEYPEEKLGRLDLRVKMSDGTICQIEMQRTDQNNTIKRLLCYLCRGYSDQIKRGCKYKDLKRTIGIFITNYELSELKDIQDLDAKWQLIETKQRKNILTKDIEARIIEIPKVKKILEKNKDDIIAQWMMFLDNPDSEEVEKIMEKNDSVKRASSVLHEMSEDEKLRRLAELREKAILEEESVRDGALEEGAQKKALEIAKTLKRMNMSTEDIEKATGLAKDEIEKL